MLDKLFREPLGRFIAPLAKAIAKTGVSANVLTLIGTATVAVGAWFVATGDLALGGWILFAGVVFDILDGLVAKTAGTPNRGGAFLDSTTDRVSDGLVFSGLAWNFAGKPLGLGLSLAAGVLAFLTSYIRARGEGLGIEANVGIAERPERMTLVITGLILGWIVPLLALLVAISLVTVVQRFLWVWSRVRRAGQS